MRPRNLNFFTIQFPITAIVSLLHRMSGILLIFSIPAMLWILQMTLKSEQQWDSIGVLMHNIWIKGLCTFLMMGLLYHFIAGIRHLLMDIGIGDTKSSSRLGAICTAWGVILGGIIMLGYIIW